MKPQIVILLPGISCGAISRNSEACFLPKNSLMRGNVPDDGADLKSTDESKISSKPTSGWGRAMEMTVSWIWASSVGAERKNFLRAGTLKKRSLISMEVPFAIPHGRVSVIRPASVSTSKPSSESAVLVLILSRDTAAMLGRASPRKPSVVMASTLLFL